MDELSPQERTQGREPMVVEFDPKCLHSALKEFFEPLRTNDSRADFFAIYRKESDEFDRDYTRKYDEDLNTSLIFAGLFSAVSSAFIIDVQSKLEPDPNEMTAAYMQILIHAVNTSLFPNAIADATPWTGPPHEIVTVQSLLYASLATSLFAAFLAMLGKQWVNRYLRNRGGSAADKSRDRQQKLDGLERWHFQLVIEGLPVILQLGLLLLGCALSLYLWTISRTVAGVAIAVTTFGVALYLFFTLAATSFYSCPYQTPLSLVIRTLLSHHHTTLIPLISSLIVAFHSSKKEFQRFLHHLHTGVWGALSIFGCTTNMVPETTPLAIVTSQNRIFHDASLDWGGCKADTRCIAWVLYSTTDSDMIFSTVRFAADIIWYPEIAGDLSPHVLADLFSECLVDRRVIVGRAEQAGSIGMALALVLGIQLSVEPEREDLGELCERVIEHTDLGPSPEATFELIASVLDFVAQAPVPIPEGGNLGIRIRTPPKGLSGTFKVWFAKVILQTVWRWRRVQDPATIIDFYWAAAKCGPLVDDDPVPIVFKTIWILVMAICLGVTVDMRDLYPPNNDHSLFAATDVLRDRLAAVIREGHVQPGIVRSSLSTLGDLDLPQTANFQEACVLWLRQILDSGYSEDMRYLMASAVVVFFGKQLGSPFAERFYHIHSNALRPLLDFLLLSERLYPTELPPYPGVIALRILSIETGRGDFDPAILPILAATLQPTHPLQSRRLALKLFQRPDFGWLSPQAEVFSSIERARLLEAIGDPFQFPPDLPPQDGQPNVATSYDPILSVALLIEFAGSDLWRDHLRPLNFASCEEFASTEEGRGLIFQGVLEWGSNAQTEPFSSATKLVSALRRLEELNCWNTAEVVLLWAWTDGFVDATDSDTWEFIGHETLKFYRIRGMERLGGLSRHIKGHLVEHPLFAGLFRTGRPSTSCRVAGVRRPVRIHMGGEGFGGISRLDVYKISQTSQLRRLYQLFWLDPTTWEEAIAAGKSDEVLFDSGSGGEGPSILPVQFWGSTCDYP